MILVTKHLKLVGLILVALIVPVVYLAFFSKLDNLEHMNHLKVGQHKSEVIKIMGNPDGIYPATYLDTIDTALVYQYEMGLLAPDDLRVHLRQDTVYSVWYSN